MARGNCVVLAHDINQERESLVTNGEFYVVLIVALLLGFIVWACLSVVFNMPLLWVATSSSGFSYFFQGLCTQAGWYEQEGRVAGWKRVGIGAGWPLCWLHDLFFSRY